MQNDTHPVAKTFDNSGVLLAGPADFNEGVYVVPSLHHGVTLAQSVVICRESYY